MNLAQSFSKIGASFGTFHFKLAGVTFEPTYVQALVILALIFVLIWTLARIRSLYLNWSFSAWYKWFVLGFVFAVVVEGFLMVGGKTLFIEMLGWKNAPKPIVSALDSGRGELRKVLGVSDSPVNDCVCRE